MGAVGAGTKTPLQPANRIRRGAVVTDCLFEQFGDLVVELLAAQILGDDLALMVDQEVCRNSLDGVILGRLVSNPSSELTWIQFIWFSLTALSQLSRLLS